MLSIMIHSNFVKEKKKGDKKNILHKRRRGHGDFNN